MLLALPLSLMGCLVTDEIEFRPETSYPPSIESRPGAENPLDEVIVVDTSATGLDGGTGGEIMLEVFVRDPNVQETLFAKLYRDNDSVAIRELPIPPDGSGATKRAIDIRVPMTAVATPGCHRLELRVTSQFEFGSPDPVDPDDLGTAVWWVATHSGEDPSIDPSLCPR